MATSAAARVFGIAELLDMILLEYAASEQQLKRFRPVTKLFVLQRVNHMFHDAIVSSMVLRRAMFLEHADEEEMRAIKLADRPHLHLGSDHNLAAVNWLVDSPPSAIGVLDFSWPRKPERVPVPKSAIFKARVFTRGILHPTASWRNASLPWPHLLQERISYDMQRSTARV
ncbi:hypothetical protein CBER1_07923 [Cercospora berteroae]|uniref:Uncharacterized protein n=1 Tax=Cercospora berteroae TaxID=357750 RepID=A0A2S6BUF6_9PEZI|nr:hypothetical protein CBER1_07923 [Cercospora berteroae]